MTTLAQRLQEERRGAILLALEEAPGYRANERLLHDFVEELGLRCSRDQIRTDMSWLKDQGLIRIQEVARVMIAEITQGGMDARKVAVPGVARPDPAR